MKYNSFEDMQVWQDSMALAIDIFGLTVALPRAEDYGLTSQIRRSALSISANIAEGFGRNGSPDKSRFYIISRGSAYETKNHLIYGNKVGYFETQRTTYLEARLEEIIYNLNKLIKSLADKK